MLLSLTVSASTATRKAVPSDFPVHRLSVRQQRHRDKRGDIRSSSIWSLLPLSRTASPSLSSAQNPMHLCVTRPNMFALESRI